VPQDARRHRRGRPSRHGHGGSATAGNDGSDGERAAIWSWRIEGDLAHEVNPTGTAAIEVLSSWGAGSGGGGGGVCGRGRVSFIKGGWTGLKQKFGWLADAVLAGLCKKFRFLSGEREWLARYNFWTIFFHMQ
jgi:hypothetical protein